ncbi:MAG: hypothetical protein ACP5HQ_04215 [Thermoprotei archaeon]
MNPLTNALKILTTTAYQIVLAAVFFAITARVSDPAFFGQVAVVQLLEAFVGTAFFLVPQGVITRDVASSLAKGTHRVTVEAYLAYPLLTIPLYLFFLTMPNYVWLALPYLYLFLVQNVVQGILYGSDMFTEAATVTAISATFRWGVSILAVLEHSFTKFVEIWTVGALAAVAYGLVALRRRQGGISPKFDAKLYFTRFLENKYLYGQALASFLSSQGDRLVTVYFLGQTDLGLYQFAALVASVPALILGTIISTSYLAAASYYRSKGVSELDISRPAFRVATVITMVVVVLSMIGSEVLVPLLFPSFSQSLRALQTLMLATLVGLLGGVPIASVIAFNRDQRPILVLTGLNSVSVVSFSAFFIPRFGIEGGALAQLATAILSVAYTMYYSSSVNAIKYELKDVVATLVVIGVTAVEVVFVIHFLLLSLVMFVIGLLSLRFLRVVSKVEYELLLRFVPNRMRAFLEIISLALVM